MAKTLMKGNHALSEAAIRAGCRFFAGYPITPQSEILEYMAERMPEVGGTFVQTESELAGISMVYGAASCGFRSMTSSSGPGFSLLQEGISYLASGEVPAVIVDVMRYGSGLGDITPGQSDYLQLTKNGGHGDYRCIVLAPGSMQEAVDHMGKAFDLAEKYQNPIIVAIDGAIGQMLEAVTFEELKEHDPDQYDWAIKGKLENDHHKVVTSKCYFEYFGKDYDRHVREKFDLMNANEQECECYKTEDADVVLVSYGTMSRVCRDAVDMAREQGLKVGLFRPISIWPFPTDAMKKLSPQAFLTVEMSAIPQMAEDVSLAARGVAPNYSFTTGAFFPDEEEIIAVAENVLAGKAEEV